MLVSTLAACVILGAAIHCRGIVIQEYGLQTVQEYMHHIRDNAETCVRNLLRDVAKRLGPTLSARDYLDDGSRVGPSVPIQCCHTDK
jgi:N-methylhydantoinase B/oxoprolinase/acetone carboxylase alpha subunit